jgi:hypothetical protein
MFFTKVDQKDEITKNVDEYGDSYARSTTAEELKEVKQFSCSGSHIAYSSII